MHEMEEMSCCFLFYYHIKPGTHYVNSHYIAFLCVKEGPNEHIIVSNSIFKRLYIIHSSNFTNLQ